MLHHVAHAQPGDWLFVTMLEGRALWDRVGALPGLVAACLMPDHLHVLLEHADPSGRLADLRSGYARWRNAARGQSGPVWAEAPPPLPLPDEAHARRTLRYVLLNPCRGGLTRDPLDWPYSTHRDALGLAAPPVIAPVRGPEGFHAWVSGDPSTHVAGTPYPHGQWGQTQWSELRQAVAGVCRLTLEELRDRGVGRRLLGQTAWVHGVGGYAEIAEAVGVERQAVWRWCRDLPARGGRFAEPGLAACVAAVGDPRFRALDSHDRRRDPLWLAYREQRRRRRTEAERRERWG